MGNGVVAFRNASADKVMHFIEAQQLDRQLLSDLFRRADEFRAMPRSETMKILPGVRLMLLFYEPSTRTRASFEAAILNLGGQKISTENAKEFSSFVKGESLEDTIRVVQAYADCVVIRHEQTDKLKDVVWLSRVPIISAGEGIGQHPTQALTDVYTLWKELGRIDGVKIALVGDLANGRTARSLSYLLGKYEDVTIYFVSTRELRMKDDIKDYLEKHGVKFEELENINDVIRTVNAVYMTRTQNERVSVKRPSKLETFFNFFSRLWVGPSREEKARKDCRIDVNNFDMLSYDARLMHPLPINKRAEKPEISLPLRTEQEDPRVAYFRQSEYAVLIRMALLEKIIPRDKQ